MSMQMGQQETFLFMLTIEAEPRQDKCTAEGTSSSLFHIPPPPLAKKRSMQKTWWITITPICYLSLVHTLDS